MIRRPPRSTLDRSSAASDVYKRQGVHTMDFHFVAWGMWKFLSGTADIASARLWLQQLAPLAPRSRITEASYRLRLATVLLHEKKLQLAIEEAERALTLCQESSFFMECIGAHA